MIKCLAMGYAWFIEVVNFDQIGYAMFSIFTLATVEGYPDYMALNMDANDADTVI